MAHIDSIGAGLFSDLSLCTSSSLNTACVSAVATGSAAAIVSAFHAAFVSSATIARIRNVREFPAVGTPANVVNVPTYGQKTSNQIQGQADPSSMEITLNYVASDWHNDVASASVLGGKVGDGNIYAFRFTLLNSKPTANYESKVDGFGSTVKFSMYYWVGKIDALLVTPQLTDANTATLTLTLSSDFYGAYTI